MGDWGEPSTLPDVLFSEIQIGCELEREWSEEIKISSLEIERVNGCCLRRFFARIQWKIAA